MGGANHIFLKSKQVKTNLEIVNTHFHQCPRTNIRKLIYYQGPGSFEVRRSVRGPRSLFVNKINVYCTVEHTSM